MVGQTEGMPLVGLPPDTQPARDSEAMALEGYRAGKLTLPTLLLLRRQLLEARRDAADRLLETALLGINLAQSLGSWP